jgi:hypothetical protein
MTKAVALKAKASKDTDNTGDASWIPKGPVESSKKKADLSISTILELQHISTKMDKLGRLTSYFLCVNPVALSVIRDYCNDQGLDISLLSLPFWVSGDTNDVMVRAGRQRVSLTDEQLNESCLTPLRGPCDFKYYNSGKTGKSGFSIHM